jgi:hypothetical protein
MGSFFIRCKIENIIDRGKSAIISKALVDIGSECTWIPTTISKRSAFSERRKTCHS